MELKWLEKASTGILDFVDKGHEIQCCMITDPYINSIILGSYVKDVDGYYLFYFNEDGTGPVGWTSVSLREIAEVMDRLNKPWDDKVTDELGE